MKTVEAIKKKLRFKSKEKKKTTEPKLNTVRTVEFEPPELMSRSMEKSETSSSETPGSMEKSETSSSEMPKSSPGNVEKSEPSSPEDIGKSEPSYPEAPEFTSRNTETSEPSSPTTPELASKSEPSSSETPETRSGNKDKSEESLNVIKLEEPKDKGIKKTLNYKSKQKKRKPIEPIITSTDMEKFEPSSSETLELTSGNMEKSEESLKVIKVEEEKHILQAIKKMLRFKSKEKKKKQIEPSSPKTPELTPPIMEKSKVAVKVEGQNHIMQVIKKGLHIKPKEKKKTPEVMETSEPSSSNPKTPEPISGEMDKSDPTDLTSRNLKKFQESLKDIKLQGPTHINFCVPGKLHDYDESSAEFLPRSKSSSSDSMVY